MSLTLKVTIPMETLEKLQCMRALRESKCCPFDNRDNHTTVGDVCKAVLSAMQELPYDLTPKKIEDKEEICSRWIDEAEISREEQDKSSHEKVYYSEPDRESEGYDEINAEEFDRRSTGVSFHVNGSWGRWETRKDGKIDGSTKNVDAEKDNETRDSDAPSESRETETDAAHDSHADTEIDDEEDKATESDAVSGHDDQMHITVDVNNDASRTGTNFRILMDASDTWVDLADNIRRMTDLFNHQMTFYFQHSFYDQRCQESLSRVSSSPEVVARMNIDAYGRPG